jgi:hypothetical protein
MAMIQQKQKKCKGTGRSINFGCGLPKYLHKFGLCKDCFFDWLYNTHEGRSFLDSTQIRAKKHVQKEQKKEQSAKKEETRQKKIDLMGSDRYRAKYVQPVFNEIARLIDYGQPCVVTGLYDGKMNGGHFMSVNSNRTICLNLHNIHNQAFESNHFKSGDNLKYRQGLIDTYGLEYLEKVEALKRIQPLHLTKQDLIEFREIAMEIRNELKKNPTIRTPKERIALREEINRRIGIYN